MQEKHLNFIWLLAAKYNETLKQLAAMGFKDNGGKLSKLVEEKKGNLSEVLDAIQAHSKSSNLT
jgi:ACT domain-containing protein